MYVELILIFICFSLLVEAGIFISFTYFNMGKTIQRVSCFFHELLRSCTFVMM